MSVRPLRSRPIGAACPSRRRPRRVAALAFVVALGEVRGRLRRSIQRGAVAGPRWGPDERRWPAEGRLRPFWLFIHALSSSAAPLSRRIEWAGIRYRVKWTQDVIVERREEPC